MDNIQNRSPLTENDDSFQTVNEILIEFKDLLVPAKSLPIDSGKQGFSLKNETKTEKGKNSI
jgi:hypothetical protein